MKRKNEDFEIADRETKKQDKELEITLSNILKEVKLEVYSGDTWIYINGYSVAYVDAEKQKLVVSEGWLRHAGVKLEVKK